MPNFPKISGIILYIKGCTSVVYSRNNLSNTMLRRLALKSFLCYKGWMYESAGHISKRTQLWFYVLHKIVPNTTPRDFQAALPRLPLPSVKATMSRHLLSMRPLLADADYSELEKLSANFQRGLGLRLQCYLWLKWLTSTNYVTDWWEKFIYLSGREPIMINSNYYGMDTLRPHPNASRNQAARAANLTWATLLFRRMIERHEVSPFTLNPRTKVPFCTMQYERLFNSCRVPGKEEDTFRCWPDIRHIAVLCRGRWFKLGIQDGERLLEPAELQLAFQEILDTTATPQELAPSEEHLAALTAANRENWASVRQRFFSAGINQQSLDAIESAAFVVVLDDEHVGYDPNDPSKLDAWAATLLHGKGNNRWYDKSFNLIVSANGRMGINAEHSWGDAVVTAHFMEYVVLKDLCEQGYAPDGNCHMSPETAARSATRIRPERLRWDLSAVELRDQIDVALQSARALIEDVEVAVLVWTQYGKGFIKQLNISPDAFIQATLQLAYFRNQHKFSLTYEAAIARLFRDGRTETIRSCTLESCAFVRAMLDPSKTREERLCLLRKSAERHQQLTKDAMCGKGIDRHLFALYVILRHLKAKSPFFDAIFPPQYTLSTSQTPLKQCSERTERLSKAQLLELVSAGGGFGPVTATGYGVSYIIAGEQQIAFHISSKKSAENTSSTAFRDDLVKSLHEMHNLLAATPTEEVRAAAVS